MLDLAGLRRPVEEDAPVVGAMGPIVEYEGGEEGGMSKCEVDKND